MVYLPLRRHMPTPHVCVMPQTKSNYFESDTLEVVPAAAATTSTSTSGKQAISHNYILIA